LSQKNNFLTDKNLESYRPPPVLFKPTRRYPRLFSSCMLISELYSCAGWLASNVAQQSCCMSAASWPAVIPFRRCQILMLKVT